jgi:4-amino-4-deoxy-L-arabinose transferase-like glycosyltransferase
MAALFNTRGGHCLVLLAAALPLYFWGLGAPSLWDVDEGRNATCALEMYESGNWIVPTFNGVLRADKPALLYWLQVAAYAFFGVSEFSARLPSALAALATLLLIYELGRSMFGKTTGFWAALIAGSTPMLVGAARFANPDALLHFFTVLTLLIFWQARTSSAWGWLAMGATTALGMLAKGPVAVVLPAAVGFLYLFWEGRWRQYYDRRMLWAALSFTALAGPWYIQVAVDTKARFWQGFFLRHNVQRFLSPLESHDGSPLYYLLILLGGLAPWSIFLLGAWWYGYWSARREPGPRWQTLWRGAADVNWRGHPESTPPPWSAYRLLLCWIAVYVVFFTVAQTKLPNYVLPAVAPCAILIARMLDRWQMGTLSVPRWCLSVGLALWLTFGAGIAAGMLIAGGAIELPALHGRAIPELTPLALAGITPVAGAIVAWPLLRRERRGAMLACLGLAAVATAAPIAVLAQTALNDHKAAVPLVADSGAFNRGEDMRLFVVQLGHLPSLNFYAQRDVALLDDWSQVPGYLHYPIRVFVFMSAGDWHECQAQYPGLGREVARRRDFYSRHEIVVVTNQ